MRRDSNPEYTRELKKYSQHAVYDSDVEIIEVEKPWNERSPIRLSSDGDTDYEEISEVKANVDIWQPSFQNISMEEESVDVKKEQEKNKDARLIRILQRIERNREKNLRKRRAKRLKKAQQEKRNEAYEMEEKERINKRKVEEERKKREQALEEEKLKALQQRKQILRKQRLEQIRKDQEKASLNIQKMKEIYEQRKQKILEAAHKRQKAQSEERARIIRLEEQREEIYEQRKQKRRERSERKAEILKDYQQKARKRESERARLIIRSEAQKRYKKKKDEEKALLNIKYLERKRGENQQRLKEKESQRSRSPRRTPAERQNKDDGRLEERDSVSEEEKASGLQPLSSSDPRLDAREQALEEYELEEEKIIEKNINKLKNIKIQIEFQERKKQNQVRLHVYNFNKFIQDEKIIKATNGMSSQALENLRSSQKAQEERRKKGIAKAIIQKQKFEKNYERRKQILEKHIRRREERILAQRQEEAIPQEEDLNRLEDEMKEELITEATAEGIPEDRQEQALEIKREQLEEERPQMKEPGKSKFQSSIISQILKQKIIPQKTVISQIMKSEKKRKELEAVHERKRHEEERARIIRLKFWNIKKLEKAEILKDQQRARIRLEVQKRYKKFWNMKINKEVGLPEDRGKFLYMKKIRQYYNNRAMAASASTSAK